MSLYNLEQILVYECGHDVDWGLNLGCDQNAIQLAKSMEKWQHSNPSLLDFVLFLFLEETEVNRLTDVRNEVAMSDHDAF